MPKVSVGVIADEANDRRTDGIAEAVHEKDFCSVLAREGGKSVPGS